MIRLLQLLFLGHVHKWEIITSHRMYVSDDPDKRPLGTRYTVQCEHCGTVTHQDAF